MQRPRAWALVVQPGIVHVDVRFPPCLTQSPRAYTSVEQALLEHNPLFTIRFFFSFNPFFYISKIVTTNTVSKKYSTCRQAHAGTVAHEGGCAKARVRQKQGDVCAFLVVRMIMDYKKNIENVS